MSAPIPVVIERAPENLTLRYVGTRALVSGDLQAKIDEHWDRRMRTGARFERGPIFTVASLRRDETSMELELQLTDYAHYLYTIDGHFHVRGACRVVYTASLVVTSDRRYVFGQMAAHTSTPGRLQGVGGSLDLTDLRGDAIDPTVNILRELFEELGLDTSDRSIVCEVRPRYLKSGGENRFFGVVFRVELGISSDQLRSAYEQHVARLQADGTDPEFDRLVVIDTTREGVDRFLRTDHRPKVDYLRDVLTLDAASLSVL